MDQTKHFVAFRGKGHVDEVLLALFDDDWYESQLEARGIDVHDEPLSLHFSRTGAAALLSPHPLFDAEWYLSQNEDARHAFDQGVAPFDHFATVGHRKGFWPHPLFDVAWYRSVNSLGADQNVLLDFARAPAVENRSTHPHFDAGWYAALHIDPRNWKQPAIVHFVRRGARCGYKPNPWGFYSARDKLVSTDPRPYKLGAAPLVSIIIANLDGERYLRDLLPSLQRQSYTNFELVFVDNGSADRSIALVKDAFPTSKIVALDSNKGFAEANNIGYRIAAGELIVLLNNDTVVSDSWLESQVRVMQSDVNLGAVCPKIRFAGRFCELVLRAQRPFVVDEQSLLASLDYKKVFTTRGRQVGASISSMVTDAEHLVELKVPFQETPLRLTVTAEQETSVALTTRHLKRIIDVTARGTLCELALDGYDRRNAFHVVNNAGGAEPGWLMTADIGFGAMDSEQFSFGRDVALLCGCAAMIRRDALLGKELFLDAFVAYFEDSELSQRLRRDGFRIRYCPEAIVYHHHSSTTVEKSTYWMKQVYRNRLLYRYICADLVERRLQLSTALSELAHHQRWLESHAQTRDDETLRSVLPSVRAEVPQLCDGIDRGQIAVARPMRVGVFNAYWNTLGGGEAHALAFASFLADHFRVELISVDDFDVDFLERYFDLKPRNFIKRLVSELTPSVTAEYDVFVNSTYMNECPSHARHSWYLVSFPSASPSREFLKSYHFVANSHYTFGWMTRYWGELERASIINPCVSAKLVGEQGAHAPKERMLLSVGRFFRRGHSKNQVAVAKCFRRLCLDGTMGRGWKLVLIGSVGDLAYVDEVREHLAGLNAELVTNASTELLRSYYARAFVYIHASGLGEDPEISPANFEHFGMTVAEAAANGCIPIVYDAAGPKEIVDMLGVGFKFRDLDELERALLTAIGSFPSGASETMRGARQLSSERLDRDLEALFADIVADGARMQDHAWSAASAALASLESG